MPEIDEIAKIAAIVKRVIAGRSGQGHIDLARQIVSEVREATGRSLDVAEAQAWVHAVDERRDGGTAGGFGEDSYDPWEAIDESIDRGKSD